MLRIRCVSKNQFYFYNKKHLKNVGPIRHCEPPHAPCPQRQGVTEGTAMAPWNGPNNSSVQWVGTARDAVVLMCDTVESPAVSQRCRDVM